MRYIYPLKSITNALDQKECWIQQMKFLVKDFKILLNLPFNEYDNLMRILLFIICIVLIFNKKNYRFWSTVVFNKNATVGLCTFLQEAAPSHLIDQLPQDDDVLYIINEIEHYAYLLLKRLTTSAENKVIIFIPD